LPRSTYLSTLTSSLQWGHFSSINYIDRESARSILWWVIYRARLFFSGLRRDYAF